MEKQLNKQKQNITIHNTWRKKAKSWVEFTIDQQLNEAPQARLFIDNLKHWLGDFG